MSHRPYPSTRRAAAQMRRAVTVKRCGICRHPVSAHAEVDGVRKCTRSHDGQAPSCQECARIMDEFPLTASVTEFFLFLRTPPSGAPPLVGAAVYRD